MVYAHALDHQNFNSKPFPQVIFTKDKMCDEIKSNQIDIVINLEALDLYKDHIDYSLWYFLVIICGGDPNSIQTAHCDKSCDGIAGGFLNFTLLSKIFF